jgi:hypothetical protein
VTWAEIKLRVDAWCPLRTLKLQWLANGTKIIGYATAALGILAYLDTETINLIGTLFGPVNGPRVIRGMMIFSGVMTAARGHFNTRRLKDVDDKDEDDKDQ